MKSNYALAMAVASVALLASNVMGGAPESPVDLGTAGNFTVLSKSGISTVPPSAIVGDIGVSPIAGEAFTGFSLTMDSTIQFSTSAQLTGKAYAANYSAPTPTMLTVAIGDMGAAYADAVGRTLPDATELGTGNISGLTLVPGLYKWGTGVLINDDVILKGGPNHVWIFQIAGDLTMASDKSIILSDGAQANHIFWQVAGGAGVDIGTGSHFEGIILAQTMINFQTGASHNGRLYAQTAVTLDFNSVVKPDESLPPLRFVQIDHESPDTVLALTNKPDIEITLEYCEDLVMTNWIPLSTYTPTVSPYVTTDTTATATADIKRFYRAFYP